MNRISMSRFTILLTVIALLTTACVDTAQVDRGPESDDHPDTRAVALHVEGMT